ncbi:MAG: hypothetical protein WBP87_16460, partial [Candidatus Sulfotelmatobacter sp.]
MSRADPTSGDLSRRPQKNRTRATRTLGEGQGTTKKGSVGNLESYSAVDSALESREFLLYIPVSSGITPKGLSGLAGMLSSQAGC